jgi:hypothetical protein
MAARDLQDRHRMKSCRRMKIKAYLIAIILWAKALIGEVIGQLQTDELIRNTNHKGCPQRRDD